MVNMGKNNIIGLKKIVGNKYMAIFAHLFQLLVINIIVEYMR